MVRRIARLVPVYMVMGERGMHDMTELQMPLPDNTAAMMAGQGPFGAVGMGGMFSVLKVRTGQPRGDYADLGWYPHPPGRPIDELRCYPNCLAQGCPHEPPSANFSRGHPDGRRWTTPPR